jgi:CRP-like cAMP-binding protein
MILSRRTEGLRTNIFSRNKHLNVFVPERLQKGKKMKKLFSILAAMHSFHGLAEDQLREIKQIAVDRHISKGKLIYSEGDPNEGFYVVVAGIVKIF